MWSNVVAKETFKRSLVIFAASVGGAVIAALLLWWHHVSLAERCNNPIWRKGEPVTCSYSTTLFGDWLSLAMLASVYFVLCVAVAWLWGWAKRRSIQRAR